MFTIKEKNRQELEEELNDLEFQIYRMQENMKDLSKDAKVLGIDQSKHDEWMIVSSIDDGQTCKIMLTDCKTAYRGKGCFSLVASYKDDAIHIGDISLRTRVWLHLHEIFKRYCKRPQYTESHRRHRQTGLESCRPADSLL